MKVTKHAHARFKQRQNIKNEPEMERRITLAIERGSLLPNCSSQPNTLCYAFAGYKYIVSEDKNVLITVMGARKLGRTKKRFLIEEAMRRRQRKEMTLSMERNDEDE